MMDPTYVKMVAPARISLVIINVFVLKDIKEKIVNLTSTIAIPILVKTMEYVMILLMISDVLVLMVQLEFYVKLWMKSNDWITPSKISQLGRRCHFANIS